MIVFLNGEFVPEQDALVSVLDRSFLYGDGLFETMRVGQGTPFLWQAHLDRFLAGTAFLKIALPFAPDQLLAAARELATRNHMPDCLLRMTLSRGVGLRGYSPRGADRPFLVMTVHPLPPASAECPPAWRLVAASSRLPAHEPLAHYKTCNKLTQIMARAEADARDADEALLLNTDNHVVEASSANLFWIEAGTVVTPPLAEGILPGVTRALVLDICRAESIPSRESNTSITGLFAADGVFLSLSTVLVAEAISLDARPLRRSPLTLRLAAACQNRLCRDLGNSSRQPGPAPQPSASTR